MAEELLNAEEDWQRIEARYEALAERGEAPEYDDRVDRTEVAIRKETAREAIRKALVVGASKGYSKEWCMKMAQLEAGQSIGAGVHAKAMSPVPDDVMRDALRLDWLEEHEASLITHLEEADDGEYGIWWTVASNVKKIRADSLSGHPLGSVRAAIDAALARYDASKGGHNG